MKPNSEISPERFGRDACWQCYRAKALCLCAQIKPFELSATLGLLIHPKEFQRTVGTARLVKLSIRNARTWTGYGPEFDSNLELQALIQDDAYQVFVLFPGPNSLNLSEAQDKDLKAQIKPDKKLVILVIDGTWANAKRMIRLSKNLSALPKLSFNVTRESQYQFRKQPKKFCLSTVEAVHLLIEQLEARRLASPNPANAHHHLLEVFQSLVEEQLEAQSPYLLRHAVPRQTGDVLPSSTGLARF